MTTVLVTCDMISVDITWVERHAVLMCASANKSELEETSQS